MDERDSDVGKTTMPPMTALILAGARPGQDPVAEKAGVPIKILAAVDGIPMVVRVLETLKASPLVGKRILCGPSWEVVQNQPGLVDLIDSQQVGWTPPQPGPSLSVHSFLGKSPQDLPLLVTTADHALLSVEMVEEFLQQASHMQMDVAVAVVPYAVVAQAYPQSKRTVIRFRGGGYCGCNMFVLRTAKARQLVEFWTQVEAERKRPLRLIWRLGFRNLLRYVLGRLTLSDALNELGQRMSLTIREVILPFPEAAVDVDTIEDLALVEEILAKRKLQQTLVVRRKV